MQSSDPWNSHRSALHDSPQRDGSNLKERASQSPGAANLDGDNDQLENAKQSEMNGDSISIEQNGHNKTQSMEDNKLSKKTLRNQTYLYDIAKKKNEIQTQRLQEQRDIELKQYL